MNSKTKFQYKSKIEKAFVKTLVKKLQAIAILGKRQGSSQSFPNFELKKREIRDEKHSFTFRFQKYGYNNQSLAKR